MKKNTKDTIQRVIDAGEKAVEELIKVAEEGIITGHPDDDLAAVRLKNAAATKKLAIFDAFEILQRIENERNKLDGTDESGAESLISAAMLKLYRSSPYLF